VSIWIVQGDSYTWLTCDGSLDLPYHSAYDSVLGIIESMPPVCVVFEPKFL
jgi:hypothetical protein